MAPRNSKVISIDLTRPGARWLFLLVVLFLSSALAFFAGKAWLAEHWNVSASPDRWLAAARLEPGNARYWAHLGLYWQLDMDHQNIQKAIAYFQRAALTDPRSAQRWMNLADAYREAGEPARAEQAYERAQEVYPISADVSWRYGGFLLSHHLLSHGEAEIRRALLIEPSLAAGAVAEIWSANPNVTAMLDKVLPAQSADYLAAQDFFLSQQLLDPALAVWNRQFSLGLAARMADEIPLVNALIDHDRLADARRVWEQALRATSWPRDRRVDSLVFNGGFEHPIANGGFDWREIPTSAARFSFDSGRAHSGSRSLRIDFDRTTNLDFQGLLQYVSVSPASRYRFSAYLRTERLSTDSGIRFAVFDPHHPSELRVLTPSRVGTSPWKAVETDIVTGRDTDLLEIALRRMPSAKIDNKLGGTVWVDDVALEPVGPAAKGAPR
jgi:tetratricopeptide (TPR) repeat protein